MGKTKYKVVKSKSDFGLQYGLKVTNGHHNIIVENISIKKSIVKDIIKKLKPYNVEPEIVLELVPDLLD